MKIVCVGGGPAGLYFALLMKRQHPDYQIRVLERNAPNETFGWGVVFSDETLSYLEESDLPTYQRTTEAFAHWDAIDIHRRGELIRSGGHGFSGVARKELLQILQTRCRELGVELEFRCEVTDVADFADADLIIAADGVNSGLRGRYAESFKPSLRLGDCKYIWLGTDCLFDAFTFAFHENEFGTFQAHAYRFNEDTSTFIVECDAASWKKAGFDEKSVDESVAELQAWFAPILKNRPLMQNSSRWVEFVEVKNENWRHNNIVLLGDAAHTAHFSIGSGTKLAMEDAIALAQAFENTDNVEQAVAAYDEARRPIVERTQKAATDSQTWFEHVKRYRDFPLVPFAFSLLTRSKKITYDNLALRDEAFMQEVTDWYAKSVGAYQKGIPSPPPMFTSFKLRELELANRVVVSPMCMYSAKEGVPNDFHLVHLGSRAMGGAGLIFTEMTNVTRDGRITPGCTGIYNDEQVAAWKRITDYIHNHSQAKICLQLGHAGRKGASKPMWEGIDRPLDEGAWPIVSASPLPYFPDSQVPQELTRQGMLELVEAYVEATERAERAGFDMLEVHMAHGYLLATFLSPLTNQRQDEFGGSLENRARFPLEVFRAVRAAWPEHKPTSVRISATDWLAGGISDSELVALARMLADAGVDIIDVSTGQTTPESRPRFYGRMYQAPWADLIRNEVGIPTLTVGNVSSADQVNGLLVAGRADLCALARPHLLNPHWTLAAAVEQEFHGQAWPPQYGPGNPLNFR